jgi:hypothetical protein
MSSAVPSESNPDNSSELSAPATAAALTQSQDGQGMASGLSAMAADGLSQDNHTDSDTQHLQQEWLSEGAMQDLPNFGQFSQESESAELASDARQALLLVSWGAIMHDLTSAMEPVLTMMQGDSLARHRNESMTENQLRSGMSKTITSYQAYRQSGSKRDPSRELALTQSMVEAVAATGLMPNDLTRSNGALQVLTDSNVGSITVLCTCTTTDFNELLGL